MIFENVIHEQQVSIKLFRLILCLQSLFCNQLLFIIILLSETHTISCTNKAAIREENENEKEFYFFLMTLIPEAYFADFLFFFFFFLPVFNFIM